MKLNKAIEVTYQAAGATTALDDVKMEVYDEGHALDEAKGVAAMTEIGSTGRYYVTFTPDAEGEWQVHIDSITAPGKIVKHYTVVAHDVDSVGDAVVATDGKVDTAIADVATVDGKIDGLNDVAVGDFNDLAASDVATELATYDAPTKAELDSTEGNIRGGTETLESIKGAVDSLGAPPMVG